MEIKIAFNYPEKLIKVINDYFKRQTVQETKEKREERLKEKFSKNNPFLDKISRIIIFCLFGFWELNCNY